MSTHTRLSNDVIQERVNRGYLDRLGLRVKKMRLLMVEREWNALRAEVQHISNTAKSFGYSALADDAQAVLKVFPATSAPRASSINDARPLLEELFRHIDLLVAGAPPQFTV